MKSQKNEILKNMNSLKHQRKFKKKKEISIKNENKKFSELNQCQCHTMSVSDKIRI